MKTKTYAVLLLSILWSAGIARAQDQANALSDIEIPEFSTTVPTLTLRDGGEPNMYFVNNHESHLARKKELKNDVDILFIGDSITHGFIRDETWGNTKSGLEVWKKHYKPRKAVCAGIGGDRTEGVLWRIENGLMDGIQPKVTILTIGHNNGNSPMEEIGWGMVAIMRAVRTRCPSTQIIFIPHFPGGRKDWKTSKMQQAYAFALEKVGADERILGLDLREPFLNAEGTLKRGLIPDGTHPGIKGYNAWQQAMETTLPKLLSANQR